MSEPICAMLFPDVQFMEEAKADGTVKRVLGAVPDGTGRNLGHQFAMEGVMLRLVAEGGESLGVRFLDWEAVEGKPYKLGRLRTRAEVAEVVLGRKFADREGQPLPGAEAEALSNRILVNVERYRAALALRAGAR